MNVLLTAGLIALFLSPLLFLLGFIIFIIGIYQQPAEKKAQWQDVAKKMMLFSGLTFLVTAGGCVTIIMFGSFM